MQHKKRFLSNKRARRDMWFALLFLLPTIYIIIKIFAQPIVESIIWSFYHYNLMDGTATMFIGLQNYTSILNDPDFWLSFERTLYYTVIAVLIELILGFFIALLLNQKFRGRTFFRVIIIIPWAMLTLVTGILFHWIYQPKYGALTVLLHFFKLMPADQNPVWLTETQNIIHFVILADIWKMTPFMALILMAGMQSISHDLYEAAKIDGAGFLRKIWNVTVPSLMPSILVAVVLRTIGTYRVYDILTVFTGDQTTSVSYLTFNNAFRYFYLGKSSAMAWLSTLFIVVIMVIYMRMLRSKSDTI